MWDELTDSEREWREKCRVFAREVIEPNYREYDESNSFPEKIYSAAHAQDMTSFALPEELGGLGYSKRAMIISAEDMASVCGPSTFCIGFNHGSLRPVLRAGNSEQKQAFVRDAIAKDLHVSLCLTESAQSASSLLTIKTRADKTDRGWEITGNKVMTGNGCVADLFLVLANAYVDGVMRGPTFFAVPKSDAVHVGPNSDKIGFRCVSTPAIEIDGAEVSDDHRIGELGYAPEILLDVMAHMRISGAVVMLGIVVGAIRAVMPWVESRTVAAGDPLANLSHIQLQLGDAMAEVLAIRRMIWHAADIFDAGGNPLIETAVAKLKASELAIRATGDIVQMYGWRGIDNEYAIQKRYRDARVTSIFEGTNEILRVNLFREYQKVLRQGGDL
jgi:alkylation response protein AidB-like acyl-CoA dehydrogenase